VSHLGCLGPSFNTSFHEGSGVDSQVYSRPSQASPCLGTTSRCPPRLSLKGSARQRGGQGPEQHNREAGPTKSQALGPSCTWRWWAGESVPLPDAAGSTLRPRGSGARRTGSEPQLYHEGAVAFTFLSRGGCWLLRLGKHLDGFSQCWSLDGKCAPKTQVLKTWNL
jgi:hypothetical protein